VSTDESKSGPTLRGLLVLVAVLALVNAVLYATAYSHRRRLFARGMPLDEIERRRLIGDLFINGLIVAFYLAVLFIRWALRTAYHRRGLPPPRPLPGWLWQANLLQMFLMVIVIAAGTVVVRDFQNDGRAWPVVAALGAPFLIAWMWLSRLIHRWEAEERAGR
jgi:hypothetical protein